MENTGNSDNDPSVETYYELGSRSFAGQDYPAAAQFARQALAIDAGLAPVHYLLASALMELEQYADAATAYAKCFALNPAAPLIQHAIMNWALARVRAQGGKTPELQLQPADFSNAENISIIICSIQPARFERVCRNYHELLSNVPHEIIGIHDAKSLCEGYNRGMLKAKGGILIFSHDDIEIVTPDFAARLMSHMGSHDIIGVAGTTRLAGPAWVHAGWPYSHGQVGAVHKTTGQLTVQAFDIRGTCTPNAQAIDGIFLAARRDVARRVGFDQTTFDGWHHYDLDFTFSAYLSGYRTAICNDICIVHESIGSWGADWQHYANSFMQKHGDKLPADGVNPNFDEWCLVPLRSKSEWLSVTQLLAQTDTSKAV